MKVPAAGRVTIAGAGIKHVGKTVRRAGSYRLRVTLTAKEAKTLKHRHKIRLKLRVHYAPRAGRASTATLSITDKA